MVKIATSVASKIISNSILIQDIVLHGLNHKLSFDFV